MTASITHLNGREAYDLISPEYFVTLSSFEQETMERAMANSSQLWMGMDDDRIIAIWGLIPPTLMSDIAYLWLFTTKHLSANVFTFVRHSKFAVQEMLQEYPTIVGHCKVGADRSVRWLRWLGADFGEPINGVALPFTIKAK